MITYCIKVVLCTALFWLGYQALLAPSNRHRFNRWYLLVTMVLSFIIPAIHFSAYTPILPAIETAFLTMVPATDTAMPGPAQTASSSMATGWWMMAMYSLISSLLLWRLQRSRYGLLQKAQRNNRLPYQCAQLVLLPEPVTPHSFGRFIFVHQTAYQQGQIPQAILQHELVHVVQKHSYDIVLVEALKALCWFNPVLWLYKKSLQLNHEFLADAAVIEQGQAIVPYQNLLIAHAHTDTHTALVTPFSYLLTKKRLIMMTKTNAASIAMLRQLAVLPLLALAVFIFSTKTSAQVSPTTPKVAVPFTASGIAQAELDEYTQLAAKAFNANGRFDPNQWSPADKKRIEALYLAMSPEQQAQQRMRLVPKPGPMPKSVPTTAQLQVWKNAKQYGVWIDGKRVSNAVLSQYAPNDFSHVFSSKLSKNAINYGKHYYQIDLMTNAYYDAYYQSTIKNADKYYISMRFTKKEAGAGGALVPNN